MRRVARYFFEAVEGHLFVFGAGVRGAVGVHRIDPCDVLGAEPGHLTHAPGTGLEGGDGVLAITRESLGAVMHYGAVVIGVQVDSRGEVLGEIR